jgi:prophage regulatory protein
MNTLEEPKWFFSFRDVETRTGLSRSTLYRMVGEGSFPSPVKLGRRRVGFRADAVENWLAGSTK